MLVRFEKMHGLGNDFVVIDARENPVAIESRTARALADRHSGIGCDQVILLEPSENADLRMRVFNADGGEVESCGNAARCVVGLIGKDAVIETAGGTIHGAPEGDRATVEMGEPRFGWEEIPLAHAIDTAPIPAAWDGLERPYAVNVGNPHVVFFVEDLADFALDELGPRIERDPMFPEGVNVNLAAVRVGGMNVEGVRRGGLDLQVWERGAGLTRACGTGACATAVAAVKYRQMESPIGIQMPGGQLKIEWAPGETIRMTGPATHVYSGEIDLEALG